MRSLARALLGALLLCMLSACAGAPAPAPQSFAPDLPAEVPSNQEAGLFNAQPEPPQPTATLTPLPTGTPTAHTGWAVQLDGDGVQAIAIVPVPLQQRIWIHVAPRLTTLPPISGLDPSATCRLTAQVIVCDRVPAGSVLSLKLPYQTQLVAAMQQNALAYASRNQPKKATPTPTT